MSIGHKSDHCEHCVKVHGKGCESPHVIIDQVNAKISRHRTLRSKNTKLRSRHENHKSQPNTAPNDRSDNFTNSEDVREHRYLTTVFLHASDRVSQRFLDIAYARVGQLFCGSIWQARMFWAQSEFRGARTYSTSNFLALIKETLESLDLKRPCDSAPSHDTLEIVKPFERLDIWQMTAHLTRHFVMFILALLGYQAFASDSNWKGEAYVKSNEANTVWLMEWKRTISSWTLPDSQPSDPNLVIRDIQEKYNVTFQEVRTLNLGGCSTWIKGTADGMGLSAFMHKTKRHTAIFICDLEGKSSMPDNPAVAEPGEWAVAFGKTTDCPRMQPFYDFE